MQCRAIVVVPSDGVAAAFFRQHGIEVTAVPYHVDFVGGGYNWRYFLTFIPRLIRDWWHHRRAVKTLVQQFAGQIDIVHTNTAVIDFGPALARQLGARHVWHLREFIDKDMGYKPFLGWRYLKRRIHHTDAIISITHAIAQHYDVQDLRQAVTRYDAVRQLSDAHQWQDKEKYFVFCGNISEHKGAHVAMRVFNRFVSEHPGYRLKFIGKIAQEFNWEKHLTENVAPEHRECIDHLGYLEQIDEVMTHATALLMCSRSEAQGRVTIEAMFYACPVIGANAGGTAEIVRHNHTGMLFNSDEECLEAMRLIATQPTLARHLTDNARQFACQNFSEEQYGQAILSIYNSLLSSCNH